MENQLQEQRQQSLRLRGPRPIPTPLRRKVVLPPGKENLFATKDVNRLVDQHVEQTPQMPQPLPESPAPARPTTTLMVTQPVVEAVVNPYLQSMPPHQNGDRRRPVSAIYPSHGDIIPEFNDLSINDHSNNCYYNNNINKNDTNNSYNNDNTINNYEHMNRHGNGNYFSPAEQQPLQQSFQQQEQQQYHPTYIEPAPPAVPEKDAIFQKPTNSNQLTRSLETENTYQEIKPQQSQTSQFQVPQEEKNSFEEPKTPQSVNTDWRKTVVTPDIPSPQLPPELPPLRIRSSRPPSPYKKGALDLNASQWRYHIQKNLRDFYLTTNPDSDHIHCPVGPSYYVDMQPCQGKDLCGPEGQPLFTLTLLDPITEAPKISVRRGFIAGDGGSEYFNVYMYTMEGKIEWEAVATAVVPATTASEKEHGGINSIIGGKKKHFAARQFVFKDPSSGISYIVGNRSDGHRLNISVKTEEDEEFEVEEDDSGSVIKSGKKSTKVYFYRPATAGDPKLPEKILAVLQRRKQFHKKLMKDLASFDTKRLLASSPNKRADAYGGDGVIDDGEDGTANFGWLTLFEAVRATPQPGNVNSANRDHLWQLVVALTFAVSYSQRIDTKVRSVGERLKKLGRKYKDGRFQVMYGHRHTQSSVQ